MPPYNNIVSVRRRNSDRLTRLARQVEVEEVEEVEVEEVEEKVPRSLTISSHSGLLPFHFLPSTQPRTDWPLTE